MAKMPIILTKPTGIDLKSLDRAGLEALGQRFGEPRFRGRQLFKWIYGNGAECLDEMTNLPKTFRDQLAKSAFLSSIRLAKIQVATDATVKCLFDLSSGRQVETVLIPDIDDEGRARRLTVCVSSQVGCAMGCSFCATGQMGFLQNLTAGDIFDQIWFMNEEAQRRYGRRITNIVFMGMGEPLLNYDNVLLSIACITDRDGLGLSPRRITVSTVGLARRIRQLADDEVRFNLAVSLHAPTDEKRSSIMPVNRNTNTDLQSLKESIQYFTVKTGRRITYEYCMFEGFNDTVDDAIALSKVVHWAPSKVNLIMYNPVPGLGFRPSEEDHLNAFVKKLVSRNVPVTVRRSRGQDIDAACGQLATRST